MNPSAVTLALFILEETLKHAPELYAQLRDLFTKGNPTQQDWQNLRARIIKANYRDFVPSTRIPEDQLPR